MLFKKCNMINENDYETFKECDVLVVGGGSAGISAAYTSAKKGMKTILVEKNSFLGGAAVAGLSGTICGLYYASTTNLEPKLLTSGVIDDFVKLMNEAGGLKGPLKYGKTYTQVINPFLFKKISEEMLLGQNCEILFQSMVIGVYVEDEAFKGVLIHTKSGDAIIQAKRIIDATGDADLISLANFKTRFGDRGIVQNPTMIFRAGNVYKPHFLKAMEGNTIAPEWISKKIKETHITSEYNLPREHIWLFDTPMYNEVLCNCTRISRGEFDLLNILNPIDRTYAEINGRQQVVEYLSFLKEYMPGFEDAYLIDTGSEVGIRQTNSINGIKRLTNTDVMYGVKTEDGVVKCAWPIELHLEGNSKLIWLLDDYYTIPFGCLVPEKGENIIVAGRNLDAEHEALASARVIAQCFGYGQAAATAAVMSIELGVKIRALNPIKVVNQLKEDGVIL